jgi:AcrR family transcriptional regulator
MPSTTPARRGRPPSVDPDRVLTATFELLRDKGVARLTTKDIAERAGVAEGSIFYHYKDRPGLLVAVYTRALRSMRDARARITAATGRDTLAATLVEIERYLEQALIVLYNAQADTALHAAVRDYAAANDIGPHHGVEIVGGLLADLRDAGEVRADADLDAVAFLLVSSCLARVAQPRLLGHTRGLLDRERLLDTVLVLLR